MRIGDREIGDGHPPYVIAEIGVNHDGELDRAIHLIELAAEAGADAVKFQLFEASMLMSGLSRLALYQREAGESDPVEMLNRLQLSVQQLGACVECAHALGLHALVSVFSVDLVDDAERLGWDAYKSASPDVVHRPLLERMASTGKPLIVSTGASEVFEIERARAWLDPWRERVAFLHCVSSYPAETDQAHVAACAHVGRLVQPCVVGYSDHTSQVETGFVAVRHGARILEKHFTDDPDRPGPDHRASLGPEDLKKYVWWSRLTGREAHDAYYDQRLVGDAEKRVHPCEEDVRNASRQSVVTVRTMRAGDAIGAADIVFKRPGTGMEAWRHAEVVGRTLARDIDDDTPITEDDLA